MPRRFIAAVAAAAISAVLAASGGNGPVAGAESAAATGSLSGSSGRRKAQKQAAARKAGVAAEPTPGSAPAMGLDDHWVDQVFVAQPSAVELGRCPAPSAAAQPASAAEASRRRAASRRCSPTSWSPWRRPDLVERSPRCAAHAEGEGLDASQGRPHEVNLNSAARLCQVRLALRRCFRCVAGLAQRGSARAARTNIVGAQNE